MSSIAPDSAVVLSSPHAKSRKHSIEIEKLFGKFLYHKKKIPKWCITSIPHDAFSKVEAIGKIRPEPEQTMVGLIYDLMHCQGVRTLTTWSCIWLCSRHKRTFLFIYPFIFVDSWNGNIYSEITIHLFHYGTTLPSTLWQMEHFSGSCRDHSHTVMT